MRYFRALCSTCVTYMYITPVILMDVVIDDGSPFTMGIALSHAYSDLHEQCRLLRFLSLLEIFRHRNATSSCRTFAQSIAQFIYKMSRARVTDALVNWIFQRGKGSKVGKKKKKQRSRRLYIEVDTFIPIYLRFAGGLWEGFFSLQRNSRERERERDLKEHGYVVYKYIHTQS